MYQCDGCGEWYHGDCTGLSEYEVEHKAADEVVLCPDCTAERVPLSDLEMVQRRVLRGELVPGARGIVIKRIDVHADRTPAERRARFTALLADALCGCDAARDSDRRTLARERAADVERVLYATAHGDPASASYRLRARSVRLAVCESAVLRARVLRGECTPEALAAAEPTALSVAENAAARRRLEEQLRRASASAGAADGAAAAPGDAPGPARCAHAGAGAAADPRAFPLRAQPEEEGGGDDDDGEDNGNSSNGRGAEGPARKRTRLASADVVWDGVVERNDKSTHGPCRVTGQHVSGAPGLHRLVPARVVFAGRFDLAELLAYLHDLEHSTSRRRAALLLAPRDTQDAVHYNAMYTHFTEKHRAGYLRPAPPPSSPAVDPAAAAATDAAAASAPAPPASPATPVAEELYMVPLERGAALPQFLCSDPFTNRDALAAEATHPRLLLVAVARVSTIEAAQAQHSPAPAASGGC